MAGDCNYSRINSCQSEYIEDYDQGFIDEVTSQYSYIINTISEQYSLITKIIFDYNSSNCDLFDERTYTKVRCK